MFAALLGYNPVQTLLGRSSPAAGQPRRLPDRAEFLPGADLALVLDRPDVAFDFAIAACLIAAVASLLRGRRYVHEEHGPGTAGRPSGDRSGTEIPGRTLPPGRCGHGTR